jgi:hypothetical protein
MRNVLITAAILALPLAGCATEEAACVPNPTWPQYCAVRSIMLNPYASPEAMAVANQEMLLHRDSQATTPSQHALIRSFAQQPQPSTVVIAPAW